MNRTSLCEQNSQKFMSSKAKSSTKEPTRTTKRMNHRVDALVSINLENKKSQRKY